MVFQRSAAAAGVGAGLDDSVAQVVTEGHGDRQGLHLLRGHDSAEGHPAQVLQTGAATRTLPEVHASFTGPEHTNKQNKQTDEHQRSQSNRENRFRIRRCVWTRGRVSPGSKDTSIGREGTAEAVGERGDGLRGALLDAPETNQPGQKTETLWSRPGPDRKHEREELEV